MFCELDVIVQMEEDTSCQVMGDYYFPLGLSRRVRRLVSFRYQEAIWFQDTVTHVVSNFVVKVTSLDCRNLTRFQVTDCSFH